MGETLRGKLYFCKSHLPLSFNFGKMRIQLENTNEPWKKMCSPFGLRKMYRRVGCPLYQLMYISFWLYTFTKTKKYCSSGHSGSLKVIEACPFVVSGQGRTIIFSLIDAACKYDIFQGIRHCPCYVKFIYETLFFVVQIYICGFWVVFNNRYD